MPASSGVVAIDSVTTAFSRSASARSSTPVPAATAKMTKANSPPWDSEIASARDEPGSRPLIRPSA